MTHAQKKFRILYRLLLKQPVGLSDAVVWLQGDRYDRSVPTLYLYRKGFAKKVVISGNNVLIGKNAKSEQSNISLTKMKSFVLKKGVKSKDLVVDSGALNTKDQAEHIINIAKKRQWTSFILVGSSYYQPRAFLTFIKQAKKLRWKGLILNVSAFVPWNKKPEGRTKTAQHIFKEEFEKIEKYKTDLATIDEGIKYLLTQ